MVLVLNSTMVRVNYCSLFLIVGIPAHQLALYAADGRTVDNRHVSCIVLTGQETAFCDSGKHLLYKRLKIDYIYVLITMREIV